MSRNNKAGMFLSGQGLFDLLGNLAPGRGAKARAAAQYGQSMSNIAAQQQEMVNRMMTERAGYAQRAESLLGQQPTYNVPKEVGQYQNLMASLGGELNTKLTGLANQYGTSLRDIMQKGVAESAGYAKTGMEQGLQDIQGFTNYYRQMASRQEMPGQRATEAKLGRSFAEGYKALSQQAGGGASGLGAMIDLYSNKSEALSDLGIQAAQYKAQQEAQLGSALERAQAIRGDIYNTMSQGALTRAGVLGGAEQDIATTQANLYNQGITGQANLQGAGLLTGAQYADTAYQYNKLLPWQTGMGYYMNQIASLNPYQAQADVYGQQQNAISNLYTLFGKKGIYSNMYPNNYQSQAGGR